MVHFLKSHFEFSVLTNVASSKKVPQIYIISNNLFEKKIVIYHPQRKPNPKNVVFLSFISQAEMHLFKLFEFLHENILNPSREFYQTRITENLLTKFIYCIM